MDSANSGSLQSSSGGDEEYNSRASVPPQPSFMSLPNQSHFDPFQNYLQSPVLNPNWSLPRSDPNPNLFSTFVENSNCNNNLSRSQQQGQNQNSQPAGQRNPKKRTRASRRAPTTVMTTDTSNFRALVQEFTGIPAPPFNNHMMSSHFSKTSRLDLFGTRSPTSFDLQQQLHRPFPQKLPNQTFLGYQGSTTTGAANNDHHQSLLNSVPCTSTSANINAAGNFSSANLFNIQNPLINSLLHNSPTFPLSNSSSFLVNSSKPDHGHQGSLSSFGNVETNDPFGLGQGSDNVNMTGLPNLISTDQIGRKDGNGNTNGEYCDNSSGNYGFSTTMGEEKKGEEEKSNSKKVC